MIYWLIEEDTFSDKAIFKALQDHGVPYKTARYYDLLSGKCPEFDPGDQVIFYGSIQTVKWLRRNAPFLVWIFWDSTEFDCTEYYHLFGKFLLNRHFHLATIAQLKYYHPSFFRSDGAHTFVRPNTGDKVFTGMVVDGNKFLFDNKEVLCYAPPDNTLVVLADPQQVGREWRLVICEGKVLTHSQYADHRPIAAKTSDETTKVLAFANEVLATVKFSPHPVWTLDICEVGDLAGVRGELKVLEVGSFSCSGMYDGDWNLIVQAVTQLVKKQGTEDGSEVLSTDC